MIIPKFSYDGKHYWFYVDLQSSEDRPLTERGRFLFTSVNGWRILASYTQPPHIDIENKVVWVLGAEETYDEVGTLIECRSAVVAAMVINEIKSAFAEFSERGWDKRFDLPKDF